ncbi:four helix bundle protein [Nodosilinea sp. PGN35]|uniref:four helix bundle protein n=1 Tax=Nodosilinea sp. PGN35 TaxID=3020489 RepID=UPI0023B2E309|nr:four helix bundle protein [Nodosilinea sp. TSF1-S3]MDF0369294.1 four helix bundle protein [Nodosilinea sp. TSF1-S3]
MDEQAFKQRTKVLALRVIRLVEALPRKRSTDVIGRQLIRCGTSVGANYRAACRAKSVADLIAKLGIVEEEADECLYWLELLVEAGDISETQVKSLMQETNAIVAMTVASIKTLRSRKTNPKSKI